MPDPISWAFAWPYLTAALVAGYLIGSIPFGLLVTRLAGAADPRTIGSGNIGATNVLRTGRKDLAALTLVLDALKGTLAAVAGGYFGLDPAVCAGFGAVVGHMFPVWLGFRGGKGVATFLGVLAGLYWPAAVVFAVVWLIVAAATRYSSLAALIGALATPVALHVFEEFQLRELFAALAVLLIIAHRANIRRLLAGTEPKIGAPGG